jgi:hypothetical protein
VETLRIGGIVKEGDKLAVVVPSGTVKVIANFLPSGARPRSARPPRAHAPSRVDLAFRLEPCRAALGIKEPLTVEWR